MILNHDKQQVAKIISEPGDLAFGTRMTIESATCQKVIKQDIYQSQYVGMIPNC